MNSSSALLVDRGDTDAILMIEKEYACDSVVSLRGAVMHSLPIDLRQLQTIDLIELYEVSYDLKIARGCRQMNSLTSQVRIPILRQLPPIVEWHLSREPA